MEYNLQLLLEAGDIAGTYSMSAKDLGVALIDAGVRAPHYLKFLLEIMIWFLMIHIQLFGYKVIVGFDPSQGLIIKLNDDLLSIFNNFYKCQKR